ncbi:hypothetical protein [Streptomyces diastaticus]
MLGVEFAPGVGDGDGVEVGGAVGAGGADRLLAASCPATPRM